MKETPHIVVIGGGAAGLAAAIAAARAGAHVKVLEAGKRVGSKILKTGNGRCNLTNMHVGPADYNNPGFVAPVIDEWPAARVLDFFETLGMLSVEESEGRVYPLSNSANTVLDVLRSECERLGVETLCEHEVREIKPGLNSRPDDATPNDASPDDASPLRHSERSVEGAKSKNLTTNRRNAFTVTCTNGECIEADRVIVATGGGTNLVASLGHVIMPFQPVLCPLKTDTKPLKGLSGVRAHAAVRAFHSAANVPASPFAELEGEVLFRDYGLSGIVIFDMSRLAQVGDWLSLDLIPHMESNALESWLSGRHDALCSCVREQKADAPSYAALMRGLLHTRLNDAVIRAAGCRPSEPASHDKLPAIAATAKDFRVQIEGAGDPKQAQVTRGGASVDEFDSATLESRLCPDLHVVGEALDVDGRCGGFNLHWAWASGITAGTSAARS